MIDFKTFAGVATCSQVEEGQVQQELSVGQSPSLVTPVVRHPTQLCNWSIHYRNTPHYVPIASRPDSPTEDDHYQFDIKDEAT